MAFTGLARPYVAKLTETTVGTTTTATYSDAFICGKAVSVSISPSYAEASLYGDNALAEFDREFSEAEVSVETTFLPDEAQQIMLGHTKSTATGDDKDTYIYNVNDSSDFVGFGFMTTERVNGVKKFAAIWLPKVKFSEGEDSYETKGENMTYSNPKLTGAATGDKDGNWKYLKTFATEADAIAWLEKKANVSKS